MSFLTEHQFIFIIGSPRSGTTWLQTMIGAHPQVATTVELTFFEKYLVPLLKSWEQESLPIKAGKWVKGLPHLLTEEEFTAWLVNFLEYGYAKVKTKKPDAQYILDKNPQNAYYVELIQRFIPHARFIHIIRDGRDVVCSMRNVSRTIGHQTDNIARGAKIWQDTINAARHAAKFQGYYLEIRYEQLSQEGIRVLGEVFDFCGLPISDADISRIYATYSFERMKQEGIGPDPTVKRSPGNYHKGQIGTWKTELTPIEQVIFQKIAGEMLIECGYAEQNWRPPVEPQTAIMLWSSVLLTWLRYWLWEVVRRLFSKRFKSKFREAVHTIQIASGFKNRL